MDRCLPRTLFLLVSLALPGFAGCSEDVYKAIVPQTPGTITATATHITDRQGDVFSIGVWGPGIDWAPGTGDDLAASLSSRTIDSGDFSTTLTMTELGPDRDETGVSKELEPGDYSVVFFVSGSGQPPDRFAEVRIHVNGNVTIAAPDWASWIVSIAP